MEFTQLILSQTLGLGEKKKSTSGLPFTKERNRENEKDPGKWTQNRIGKKSQAVPLDQISSKPNFEILQDEGLVTPSKSNHHGTVLICFRYFDSCRLKISKKSLFSPFYWKIWHIFQLD